MIEGRTPALAPWRLCYHLIATGAQCSRLAQVAVLGVRVAGVLTARADAFRHLASAGRLVLHGLVHDHASLTHFFVFIFVFFVVFVSRARPGLSGLARLQR